MKYHEIMAVKHWVALIIACVVAAHPLLQSPDFMISYILLSLTNAN
jgi:hypothetical protein